MCSRAERWACYQCRWVNQPPKATIALDQYEAILKSIISNVAREVEAWSSPNPNSTQQTTRIRQRGISPSCQTLHKNFGDSAIAQGFCSCNLCSESENTWLKCDLGGIGLCQEGYYWRDGSSFVHVTFYRSGKYRQHQISRMRDGHQQRQISDKRYHFMYGQ
jgi:hypothetical protein